jgi:hypothetical protein
MAPATRKAYRASTGGQCQAAQPDQCAGEDRPHRSAVTGPAETDFGNFRNLRKRYANRGPHSPAWRMLSPQRSRPVGPARNKANFCVPLQGSKITVTGNKAFSNRGDVEEVG